MFAGKLTGVKQSMKKLGSLPDREHWFPIMIIFQPKSADSTKPEFLTQRSATKILLSCGKKEAD